MTNAILNIEDILKLIPHRYPMALVDRIIDIVPGQSCVGIKNVTFNEPFFQGHFPGHPVMPGVLIVEAMAQTAGALVVHSVGGLGKGHNVYFMSIEDVKFRRVVRPGDQLRMHVTCLKNRGNIWKFASKAYVDDNLTDEATFTAMIQDAAP